MDGVTALTSGGIIRSGKPFSEAYVLPTAGFRPVRRNSVELPLCTKPVSGGKREETEMKLASVLLATGVRGAMHAKFA
jgi:hypothetical protein